eukprot:Skav234052  [mRNA]  locus=scaffold619:89689:113885:- [translate_table: standard]
MVDAIPGLRTPDRVARHEAWEDSPALPAPSFALEHLCWSRPVEAWHISEEGMSWCTRSREDPVVESRSFSGPEVDLEEEIDRFLNGLEAVRTEASSFVSSFASPNKASFCASFASEHQLRVDARERYSGDSGEGAARSVMMSEEIPDEPMELCSSCGRSFWRSRLQVHQAVCKAAHPEAARPVFESRVQRLRGLPKLPKVSADKPKAEPVPKPVPKQRPAKAVPKGRSEKPKVPSKHPSPAVCVTPVKSKTKPITSPAASVVVRRAPRSEHRAAERSAPRRSRSSPGVKNVLDTPPRIQKKEASRTQLARPRAAVTCQPCQLPEVRWPPEETAIKGFEAKNPWRTDLFKSQENLAASHVESSPTKLCEEQVCDVTSSLNGAVELPVPQYPKPCLK